MIGWQRWVLAFPHVPAAFFGLVMVATSVVASEWRIVALDGTGTVEQPEIRFSADGAFSGTTGCNRFQGLVRFEDRDLVIDGPVATTRMACPGDVLAAQDDAIIALFAGRVAVMFDPLRDSLTLSQEQATIELLRASEPERSFPETHAGLQRPAGTPPYMSAFGIEGDLEIRQEPSTESGIVGTVQPGTVLRNEGCSETAYTEWCQVARADGSLPGFAEATQLEAANSALRAGQGVFDAAGTIPCAIGAGAPMTTCAFGVARDDGGNATVVVRKTDGIERALFFSDGKFVSADSSEAGGGFDISSTKDADLHLIRVDNERYEIPDAVILGG